ncbi:hypothetical protein [Marivita sp.]|uniref:hypothetical protein n=1 Tax=Marivita sp. TaxID=2003365 RepID=UPI0025BECFDC|nr:hypothetical protein [Marivita sp.]
MKPITLALDETSINQLKRHMALRLPEMRPAHRTEFAARGLGYRTYASLLAALREGPILIDHMDPENAFAFAERVEYDIDPDDVRAVLFGLSALSVADSTSSRHFGRR